MKYTYNEVSEKFVEIILHLEDEWGEEGVTYIKDVFKYALECVNYRQETEERNTIIDYMRKHNG